MALRIIGRIAKNLSRVDKCTEVTAYGIVLTVDLKEPAHLRDNLGPFLCANLIDKNPALESVKVEKHVTNIVARVGAP